MWLCPFFSWFLPGLSPSILSCFPSVFPHSLTILQMEGAGDCPYATVIIIKPFLLPAAKSCSPEGATGRNLQQATAVFSLHSPTSRLPFYCLPAASPRSCLPHLFPLPSLSPHFIFMLSNCLLWKLMQHPLLHTDTHTHPHTHTHTHTDTSSTQTDWLRKTDKRKKGWDFFSFDVHKP